jgi:hypothetical protein
MLLQFVKTTLKRISSFSLTAQIKLNGKVISPATTFLILVFGMCCVIRSVWKRIVLPWLYPLLKKIFRTVFIRKNKLLAMRES